MTKDSCERIAVIGGGSWGTALADALARNGHDTLLWAYERELVAEINNSHTNSLFLPDIPLHPALACTASLADALAGRGIILLVTPVQVMRGVLAQAAPLIGAGAVIVNASKGIELETLKTVSQVCGDLLGPEALNRYVALSGPTFAREVASGFPSLIVAASLDEGCARRVQAALSGPQLRVYTNSDVIGVELGGAVKNVIAIAAGVSDGLEFGLNASAALITRGLAEMTRLGVRMGGEPKTFMGLSGVGDLILTCTGDLSRNRQVGLRLARGASLETILRELNHVAEGVTSAREVRRLADTLKVDMPITETVCRLLDQALSPQQAVAALLNRGLKDEWA